MVFTDVEDDELARDEVIEMLARIYGKDEMLRDRCMALAEAAGLGLLDWTIRELNRAANKEMQAGASSDD